MADTFKRFVRPRMRSSIGCSGITKHACTPHSAISARSSMKHNGHSRGQPWQVDSRGKQNRLWKSWKSIKPISTLPTATTTTNYNYLWDTDSEGKVNSPGILNPILLG